MDTYPRPPELPRLFFARDYSQATLRTMIRELRLVRVGTGAYVSPLVGCPWEQDSVRALGAIVAISRRVGPDVVFTETSAARLHGCWLPAWDGLTHAAGPRSSGRTRASFKRHLVSIPEEDIVELNGIRMTSLHRTVLDCASRLPPRWGTAVADSAIRMIVRPRRGSPSDAEARASVIRAEWADRLDQRAGHRGIQKCRPIVAHAQPLVESAGESGLHWVVVSRGLPPAVYQYAVDLGQRAFFLDLGWEFGCRDWGIHERRRLTHARGWVVVGEEYDGEGKYDSPDSDDPGRVLRAEKAREDTLRAEGAFLARRTKVDLRDPDALARRIVARMPAKVAERLRPVPGLMSAPVAR